MNYQPLTPTPLDQAINELLERVYQYERYRYHAFKDIQDKYKVTFQEMYQRLRLEELIEKDDKYTFIQSNEKIKRIQEQGGYIPWLKN